MELLVFGDGPLGRAVAAAARDQGWPEPRVVGRPASGRHDHAALRGPAVVIEASRGDAVGPNVEAALDAGHRHFVIGTTGWETDRAWVERALRDHGATAVAAPNLSLGVALFSRLVDAAVDLFGPLDSYDPFVVEWHRRGKRDRPSGTARELTRRILERHPRKTRTADPRRDGPPAEDELDVAVVRAGAAPGMHLVGFDADGETIELRLTARDRSSYAAGALVAAEWVSAAPRDHGLQSFDAVVDDLLAATGRSPVASAA